jgi:cytoskeletal protein RodZ
MIEDMETSVPPPPEEGGNRMFLIGAIILGVIFILSLVSIFALYFITRGGGTPAVPEPQKQTETALYLAGAQETVEAEGTQTQDAAASQTAAITPTDTPSPTATATQTQTPVIVVTVAPTDTPAEPDATGETGPTATETSAGATAAGATAAGATAEGIPTLTRTRTHTPVGAATALPQTGIGDSAGLPMLIVLGGISMIIIILARQIRLGRNPR